MENNFNLYNNNQDDFAGDNKEGSKNKKIILAIGALIIFLLLGGFFWWLQKSNGNSKLLEESVKKEAQGVINEVKEQEQVQTRNSNIPFSGQNTVSRQQSGNNISALQDEVNNLEIGNIDEDLKSIDEDLKSL